jgi:hypothetical protein
MCAVARRAAVLATVLVVLVTTAGCGRIEPEPPRHVRPRPAPPAPSAPGDAAGGEQTPDPDPTDVFPPPPPPALPPPPPVAGATAVGCAGKPSVSQVVGALRRDRDILPAGVNPTASVGPLCATTWQYTVLSLPNREPLQVVTRGAPGSLTVVTAGTYVCSSAVTDAAPPGILTAAHCR